MCLDTSVNMFDNNMHGNLAGEEGFEPSHAGIKIQCLNQLGDSPTRVKPEVLPITACCRPARKGVNRQIAAYFDLKIIRYAACVNVMQQFCKNSAAGTGHSP